MRRPFVVALISATLTLASGGCNPEKRVFAVEGTVAFDDGTPIKGLVGGLVSFESSADHANAAGEIQANGHYHLTSPTGAGGVPAGRYRVLVLPPEPRDPDNPPVSVMADRYRSYERSGIEVTVEEKANHIPILLRRN